MNLIAAALLACCPTPIDLGGVTLPHARAIAGRLVVASFVVATPPDTPLGRTVLGAAERDDGVSRTAVLRGRLDADVGQRVTAVGVLRVVDHPPWRGSNGVFVPGWAEIRVGPG